MSATRSVGDSFSSILGSVTAGFSAATTTLDSVGDAASVMRTKSKDWLADAQERSAAKGIHRSVVIATETALDLATRLDATNKVVNRSPELKATYDTLLVQITKAMEDAKKPEQSKI